MIGQKLSARQQREEQRQREVQAGAAAHGFDRRGSGSSSKSGSSFDKLFGGGESRTGSKLSSAAGRPPTVHELFAAVLEDRMALPEMAQAMYDLHGVDLTSAAARLLTSVDAGSGRVSFAQFQKALQQVDEGPAKGAGQRTVFKDQAAAIILDNCGAPSAPPPQSATKLSTDISSEREVVSRRIKQVEEGQARGAFAANPVMATNKVSAANPMAGRSAPPAEDPYGSREMAQTATRMYVSGELDRTGYDDFLARFGVTLDPESELSRLIAAHERSGEGKFAEFTRALQRELARVEAAR